MDINTTKEIMKLGFGLMRLPRKGLGIDIDQTSQMVDMFIEAGGTYFDTAFIYPGSEEAIRKALVERHPRESYTLATKLYASVVPTEKMAKSELQTSLKRTGAKYFDYYLLHCLMEGNYKKYEKFKLWDFVKEQKELGTIKHYGFSFHGGPALLDELFTKHPDVEFVQLQLNYADWENSNVQSRAIYEVARKHKKDIIVMEPVKGGNLAKPPKEIKVKFDEYNKDASYASWAIRFAASLDGVLTVLSGMSNVEQMQDNLSYMKDFIPLNKDEQNIITYAQSVFNESKVIPCTACHYCTKGCPKEIKIPEIFEARNMQISTGAIQCGIDQYEEVTKDASKASDCIACGQCEKNCPQKIKIIDTLKDCVANLEQ